MSIVGTMGRVAAGSAILESVRAKVASGTDIRSISPVRNVMRSSPSRLRRPVSPAVAGELRGSVAGTPIYSPSRPPTALPQRGTRNLNISDVTAPQRPSTAQTPRRAKHGEVQARPGTAQHRPVTPSPQLDEIQDVVELVEEDEILVDALQGRQFYVAPNMSADRTEVEMAEDELLASLEAAYGRLKSGALAHHAENSESPSEAVFRLRSEVEMAVQDDVPLPIVSFGNNTSPDVLLLWSWSYAEDHPWRFLQEIKGRCGVGADEAEAAYEQCEAIVRGILIGQLPWDVSPSGIAVTHSSSLQAFMDRHTRENHQSVIAALAACNAIGGLLWGPELEATWACALQHFRSNLDGQL